MIELGNETDIHLQVFKAYLAEASRPTLLRNLFLQEPSCYKLEVSILCATNPCGLGAVDDLRGRNNRGEQAALKTCSP